MSISQKIKSYLDKEKVKYQVLEHPLAYTAMEIAGSQHVPGREVIKSVIVKANGQFIMCILPAIHYLDLDKLKVYTGIKDVKMASESEIAKLFHEYEVGAEPPFGHLYGLKIVIDQILQDDDEVVFNAGTHTDMIRMKLADFIRLAKPTFADIGVHIAAIKH